MTEAIWDERLMTRARALELVGAWPLVFVDFDHAVEIFCANEPYLDRQGKKGCRQQVARIPSGYRANLEELLASLIRHGVTAHDLDTGDRR